MLSTNQGNHIIHVFPTCNKENLGWGTPNSNDEKLNLYTNYFSSLCVAPRKRTRIISWLSSAFFKSFFIMRPCFSVTSKYRFAKNKSRTSVLTSYEDLFSAFSPRYRLRFYLFLFFTHFHLMFIILLYSIFQLGFWSQKTHLFFILSLVSSIFPGHMSYCIMLNFLDNVTLFFVHM